ncbi:hypothetical protein CF326_g7744 [Tilletia indica]|nr:hypothetical protein CF326_g7744 [Tilletia indica]
MTIDLSGLHALLLYYALLWYQHGNPVTALTVLLKPFRYINWRLNVSIGSHKKWSAIAAIAYWVLVFWLLSFDPAAYSVPYYPPLNRHSAPLSIPAAPNEPTSLVPYSALSSPMSTEQALASTSPSLAWWVAPILDICVKDSLLEGQWMIAFILYMISYAL